MDKLAQFTSNLTIEAIIGGIVAAVIGLIAVIFVTLKFKGRIKPEKLRLQWKTLQKKLPKQENWLEAVIEADDMLDKVLKRKKIKGGSMGEKLVNAQKLFSDHEAVWQAHKFRKKFEEHPFSKPDQKEVQQALVALRQGLKDLGAI